MAPLIACFSVTTSRKSRIEKLSRSCHNVIPHTDYDVASNLRKTFAARMIGHSLNTSTNTKVSTIPSSDCFAFAPLF